MIHHRQTTIRIRKISQLAWLLLVTMPASCALMVSSTPAWAHPSKPEGTRADTLTRSGRRHGQPHRLLAHAAIIGGTSAQDGTYPWLAYITYKSGENVSVCSGTVVAPNVVLTAGHCAEQITTGQPDEPSGYAVVTGNVNWTASPRQVSGVSRVIIYPGFDRSSLIGDAALLILSTSTTQPPLALASYPSDSRLLEAGTSAIVAGWGETEKEPKDVTERLQWAPTVMQLAGFCESEAFSTPFYEGYELCTTYPPDYETGVCFGDSGGPLLALDPAGSDVVELGLVSRGYGECSTHYPTVFTRSDLIASWVGEWVNAVRPSPQATPIPSIPTPVPEQKTTNAPAAGPARALTARLLEGVWRGAAGRPAKPIGFVIGAGGQRLTALASTVVYRCRSGHLITEPLDGLSNDESWPLTATNKFTVRFSAGRENDTIAGAIDPTAGRMSGTLTGTLDTQRYGLCSTGAVTWSARRSGASASSSTRAAAGSYHAQTDEGDRIVLGVVPDGKRLDRLEFSAAYECPGHHSLHITRSFIAAPDRRALGRFGAFTIHLTGHGYRGRVDGTFALASRHAAFGTLRAAAFTRFGWCHTGLIPWAT